jgi:prepilin signal peptidase PulO-like enzyme (type II secretory pathway)
VAAEDFAVGAAGFGGAVGVEGEGPAQAVDAHLVVIRAQQDARAHAGAAAVGAVDIKGAASIGILLAWQGWRLLIAGGFTGFLLAAVYGAALLISRRATRKQQIPFGPFMITGRS